MGIWYDRLSAVADLNYDDSGEEASYAEVAAALQRCRELAAQFRAEPGMSGATATAALAWLSEYEATLEKKAAELDTMHSRQQLARQAMTTAKQQHATLSPQLVSSYEASFLIHNGPYLMPGGAELTGGAYVAQLRHERDLERDREAKRILDTMSAAVRAQNLQLTEPLPEKGPIGKEPGGGPSSPTPSRTPSSTIPRVSAPNYPTISPSPGLSPHPVNPPWVDPETPPANPSPPRHPSPPITNTPITVPDGPVTGTYTPPSVLDAHDPAWSDTYRGPVAKGSDAALVVGGVLGLGASALAGKALGAGLSGPAALAYQTAAGSGNALGLNGAGTASAVRVPGGGMLTSPASQAAATQAQALGAANASNDARATTTRPGGMVSRTGPAAASANGNGTSAAGSGSGTKASPGKTPAERGGAAAASSDTRKGKAKRRERPALVGYEVERLQDDPAATGFDHPALAAGTSEQLAPLATADDGERW